MERFLKISSPGNAWSILLSEKVAHILSNELVFGLFFDLFVLVKARFKSIIWIEMQIVKAFDIDKKEFAQLEVFAATG
ncbi:hypothetical protein [Parvibium lacunae]|uniref:Uncharacterized protein n=1 Tax=Parvibium lacunae TaxID=1888893 RepID=A0A368L0Q0_9BURK|nr:hypothetical protein [Parvibium lacunae]RCS57143.1 hypothetical protein DU000_10090 [Parvibium lacunae]